MNLLFIGYLHGFGGAEKMQIELANAMAGKGHEVNFISLVADNAQYTLSIKVKYRYISDSGKSRGFVLLNRYLKLKAIISRERPDLTIHFWLQSAYMCAFMGKKIAQKTIYAERGDPYDKEYDGFLGIVRKMAFKRIRGFVFQTEGAKNYFDERVQKRSCVIPNPVYINQNQYQIPKQRDKRIVTVGRLHAQKNQKLFIDALTNLNDTSYVAEIYGDGQLRDELCKYIDKKGISSRVFVKPACNNIHERIYKAALFILTSDYEGMPNALIEAMALGIPCISTDCRPGGARELIVNGINGRIVPCKDIEALSNTINELLSNPEETYCMGLKAREIVDKCNPMLVLSLWEEFFRFLT